MGHIDNVHWNDVLVFVFAFITGIVIVIGMIAREYSMGMLV